MRKWWMKEDEVERLLRAERPGAPDELVRRISASVRARPMRRRYSRLAFAMALSVLMLGSFASFGGMSYAATAASETAEAVKDMATADQVRKVITTSAAADQYEEEKNEAVVITQEVPPAGGVRGETTGEPSPSADDVVEATGTLPFTGISLLATFALSLMLIGAGVLLRRAERRAS
jgi:hypothetical protein